MAKRNLQLTEAEIGDFRQAEAQNQRQQIRERLHQYRPVDLRLSEGLYWTVSDLRIAVEQWFGVVYQDESSYQSLLHQSGFSYQRAAKVYRSQPSAVQIAQFEAELEKK